MKLREFIAKLNTYDLEQELDVVVSGDDGENVSTSDIFFNERDACDSSGRGVTGVALELCVQLEGGYDVACTSNIVEEPESFKCVSCGEKKATSGVCPEDITLCRDCDPKRYFNEQFEEYRLKELTYIPPKGIETVQTLLSVVDAHFDFMTTAIEEDEEECIKEYCKLMLDAGGKAFTCENTEVLEWACDVFKANIGCGGFTMDKTQEDAVSHWIASYEENDVELRKDEDEFQRISVGELRESIKDCSDDTLINVLVEDLTSTDWDGFLDIAVQHLIDGTKNVVLTATIQEKYND